jgi:DNA-binding SARP family transcriptional activator
MLSEKRDARHPRWTVEIRLLGPVEAWARGELVDLGPRKQRLALAILALSVNQPIAVDQLVDLTWIGEPPRTARHAVHVWVSRLRARLFEASRGSLRIITRGATYALHTDPMNIDVYQFRALVDEACGEPVGITRAAILRRALALWHGPPLADVASPLDRLCHGLEEARLAAAEEWLDAELRLGRHRAVIDQLVELTAQHPDRQHIAALHMLALYRDGRASDALRAYRRVRGRLVEEFGLDPYVELQQLESAILRADPCLDLPEPAWPASPRPRSGHLHAVGGQSTPTGHTRLQRLLTG